MLISNSFSCLITSPKLAQCNSHCYGNVYFAGDAQQFVFT